MTWVLVFTAGAVGALVRDAVARGWAARVPSRPRDGVAVVNVAGAFALGLLVGAADAGRVGEPVLVVVER